jgi:hypothetical protein
MSDGHDVLLVNKYYDKKYEDEYDIFIKRYSWIEDINDFSVGAEESDYETRILRKNLPRINFDGKFDNQGKHYLANLYNRGFEVVPTINDIDNLSMLEGYDRFLVKPVNGYASYGIMEADRSTIRDLWNEDYVIQPKIEFDSEVQFYFVGNKFEFAQIFVPKKLLSHENAVFYNPTKEEIELASKFARLNGDNFNGVQRIDFLKVKDRLLLSELEDDSPYMAIEALNEQGRKQFIDDFKAMVYSYYESLHPEKGVSKVLKRGNFK